MNPTFVSVTYGAGGTRPEAQDGRHRVLDQGRARPGGDGALHLRRATVDQLRETLDLMRDAGISNVLALRGDPPPGDTEWTATDGGFSYSRELIELIRNEDDFAIGAACFPEVHSTPTRPRATCATQGEGRRRRALPDHPAVLRQRAYFDFVARAREGGIDVPIIPGIMPITNFEQIKRFTEHVRRDDPRRAHARAAPAGGPAGRGRRPRRRLRDAPVRRAARQGRAGHPLLHAQPLARPRARSSARCAAWPRGTTPCPRSIVARNILRGATGGAMQRAKGLVLGVLSALLASAAPALGASKNVELVDNLPEAKDATAINFLDYSRPRGQSDVMLVTGPLRPEVVLAGRPARTRTARRDHRRGPAPAGRSAGRLPAPTRRRRSGRTRTWTSTSDRKLVLLSRDPRAYAGSTSARAGRARPERRDQHRRRLRGRRAGTRAS